MVLTHERYLNCTVCLQVRHCHVVAGQAEGDLHHSHQGPEQPEIPRVLRRVPRRWPTDRGRHHQPLCQLFDHDHRGEWEFVRNKLLICDPEHLWQN